MLPRRWLRDVFLRRPLRVSQHPPTVRAETQFAPRQCWLKLTLIAYGAARLFVVTHDYAAVVGAAVRPAAATLRSGDSGARRRTPLRPGRRRLALGIYTGCSRVALSFLNNYFRGSLPGRCRLCRRRAVLRHEFSWARFRNTVHLSRKHLRGVNVSGSSGQQKIAPLLNRPLPGLKDFRKPAIPRVKEYVFQGR